MTKIIDFMKEIDQIETPNLKIFRLRRNLKSKTLANKPPLISRDPQNQGGVYLQRGGLFARVSPDEVKMGEIFSRAEGGRKILGFFIGSPLWKSMILTILEIACK